MLTGKWLASMGPSQAAQELLASADLKQQRQALMQMKPHRAAALLEVLLVYLHEHPPRQQVRARLPELDHEPQAASRDADADRAQPQGCCLLHFHASGSERSAACGAGDGGAR